jgi:hypothetical protein
MITNNVGGCGALNYDSIVFLSVGQKTSKYKPVDLHETYTLDQPVVLCGALDCIE